MAAHSDSYPARIPLRFAKPSPLTTVGAGVLAAIGVAAFLLTLLGGSPERAWNAFHFNWMYWSSIAVGLVMISVALHLTNARWSWSVRRFSLAGAAFLPVSLILFPIMLIGGRHVYFHHWLAHGGHDPVHGDPVLEAKAAWLTFPGMLTRDVIALIVLFGLMLWFAYHSVRADVHSLDRAGRTGGVYGWFRRDAGTDAATVAADGWRRNLYIGVATALAFAFLWGLIGIDIAMTVEPHFFSTMFPVAFFVGAFHSALAMMIVMVVVHRRSLALEPYVTDRQFHDLGKLLFAFAVFWMYINWSQYVVIWYGLLPHEQKYFVLKFTEPFGPVVLAAVTMVFVLPFFGLLPRATKKAPEILAGFAGLILVGHWLERFLLATPSIFYHPAEGRSLADSLPQTLPLGLPEIGVALGFLGAFVACYTWWLRTFPVLPSPATLGAIPTGLTTVQMPGTTAEA
jgi:hypothetical protein